MPIKAVILDIGGVLTRVTNLDLFAQWEDDLGLARGTLIKTLFYGELSLQATLGRISMDAFWTGIQAEFGLTAEQLERLKADVWRASEWNAEMLAYVRSLRPRFKTAVLSNAWPSARSEMGSHINEEAFDVLVFSAEEGMAKPDPRIWGLALERLGVEAEAAVFVDDQAENVRVAEELGMRGIHFRQAEEALRELQEVLEVDPLT